MNIKKYSKNLLGNDFIMGDCHGTFTKLQALLDDIGFNEEVDRLFSVGDLVDRGPESHLALDWLNKPWFHAVRGNHEQMLIDYHSESYYGMRDNYIQNGGAWAVGMIKSERFPFFDAFSSLPIAIELQTTDNRLIGIVHADVPFDDWNDFTKGLLGDRADQIIDSTIWSRDRYANKITTDIKNIDLVVVGHTVVKTPCKLGNVVYIDTGSVFEKTTDLGHNGRCLTIFDPQQMCFYNNLIEEEANA